MDYLVDAVAFERPGWRVASRVTPRSTLHALYKQSDEVISVGVDLAGAVRELDSQAVDPFLRAIEAQILAGGFPGDHGLSQRPASGFDLLAHLSGEARRFTRGWSNGPGWSDDIRIVHVFPCFACELSASWPTHRFASVMRHIDVFDIAREPRPYIEIKMRGGRSGLLIKTWSWQTVRETLTFARILSKEHEGILEVKNLAGAVIAFGHTDGWDAYEERLLAHARLA
ncbi:MAG: hypothetical protein NW223_03240 [Hyphomicrobiaceae bacterium]|nr:hypothetical protein [Hyphomicrobiaceae bacterium]